MRKLCGIGGETDPGKLGELRGFLSALEWIEKLPARLADQETGKPATFDLNGATPEQLRAASLQAGA